MRDDDFEYFISQFGEATHRTPVPESAMRAWQGKLPDQLLTYWREEGWSGYRDGLLWIVDPQEYEDLVDDWLADNPLEEVDVFHVIARSAFGHLYLCGEKSGQSLTISCPLNALFALAKELKPKSQDDRDWSIRSFFGGSPEDFDLDDAEGRPLFARAMKALGALEPDEVYGFEPALVAGGAKRLENLRRLKLDQHLTLLRQFAAPSMPMFNLDIDALRRS